MKVCNQSKLIDLSFYFDCHFFLYFSIGKENLWTLNNEMIIENVGNEMNITTRSISRRNQSKSLQGQKDSFLYNRLINE